ncbi:MAG TPA: malto-oligosyltrehalose trehalohydrolase [Terriglobales bacterium]|nr:malto-oligosyltrehalose trehalohydrolase [Terriglobales bacterium]
MKSKHEIPFGAECEQDGVRFRLWAPRATRISLLLHGADAEFQMHSAGEGWFELTTPNAHAGMRYQFRIDDDQIVPDPASRFQPEGVHGPSEVIDPKSYEWSDENWRGRAWEEAVVYELHVGTFTPEGTFTAAEKKLDYLADLGITAVELMPLSSFPGTRNWGYDGVLPFAPASAYGCPEELKHFIDAAHSKKLMVFLDVVYNHIGPEGNCLPLYAPQFFTDRYKTPWGQAINFDGPCSRSVRDFFIHNALYWLEEYHFDGLRFDAVHAIRDDSHPDILEEIAAAVHQQFDGKRHVHLVLENDDNAARYLRRDPRRRPVLYSAQWNDDIHHAAHVMVTGETDGYYGDYARNPAESLARCLAEGFSFQGDISEYRDGARRGEVSRDLPPEAFVSFLQNHDQIGNRAFGERISEMAEESALRVMMTVLLLAPSPPLLFMGEEFGATTPFLFFCDFGPDLAPKVTEGRRAEFAKFAQFSSPEAQSRIPDPSDLQTFLASKLDWSAVEQPAHENWLEFNRRVLEIRRREIVPRIREIQPGRATYKTHGCRALWVDWPLHKGSLHLRANFADTEIRIPGGQPCGRILYSEPAAGSPSKKLLPLSAVWMLNE